MSVGDCTGITESSSFLERGVAWHLPRANRRFCFGTWCPVSLVIWLVSFFYETRFDGPLDFVTNNH